MRASRERAQNQPVGEASPYSLSFDEEEEKGKLIDAIQKATGSPVWGGLIRRIQAIVRSGLSLDDALAHIAAAGTRWTPPQLVGQLEARAQGAPPIQPAAPAEPPAPAPAAYAGWDDPSRWRVPEADVGRPPVLNGLLGRANGCQNGHRHEEA